MIDLPPSLDYVRRHLPTLVPYAVAALLHIVVGVIEPRVLLSWAEGILFLLLFVWAVPQVWRRLRR
jgi:hypothetical protein